MFELRLTAPDGSSRLEPFRDRRLSVGRSKSNDIVLASSAVSSKHCTLELTATGATLSDLDSRNGTYLNNTRIEDAVEVHPSDRIFVGSWLLEVVPAASTSRPASGAVAWPVSASRAPSGPIFRTPGPHREYRDLHGRYLRYSDEWDRKGRPNRLALSSDELKRAQRWLASAPSDVLPEVTRLQREFISASRAVAKKAAIKRAVVITAGALALTGTAVLAIVAGASSPPGELAADAPLAAAEATEDALDGFREASAPLPGPPDERADGWLDEQAPGVVDAEVEHTVIPFETLPDVARRYDVSVEDLASWNFLNPDQPKLEEGSVVIVRSPSRRPLPQQPLRHRVDASENSWSKLAKRFAVPVTKLQAYNPHVDLKPGVEVVVWVDPKPYKPRLPRKPIPEFTVDKRAVSIGKPAAGRLEGGIQLPKSPLYTRISPSTMWGSSQTISNVQKAIAMFRRDVDYDGALVLSDISRRKGGAFPPHKSHQAGRDIDIWLPTLKGVYKTKELKSGRTRPRRPLLPEVDWYATWGLVRALIQTEAVQYVFLDWRYQEYVYRAAVNMDATQQQLDEWIQWPRPAASNKGIFRHSRDHLSHIHVRFKCAPWEGECKGAVAKP